MKHNYMHAYPDEIFGVLGMHSASTSPLLKICDSLHFLFLYSEQMFITSGKWKEKQQNTSASWLEYSDAVEHVSGSSNLSMNQTDVFEALAYMVVGKELQ